MAYATRDDTRSRLPAIAAVTLVHVGLGAALLTGLAGTVVKDVMPIFTVDSIELPTAPPPPAPPMPRTDAKTEPRVTPTIVELPTPPVTVDLSPLPPIDLRRGETTTLTPIDPAPPAAPPSRASDATARGDRTRWITTDDYPSSALRAGEEGRVGIGVAIDADGRALACTVTASSGSPALDAATCRLYTRRARYMPARDAAGNAIATTVKDSIRWQLPD